jgi:acid phosphatase (class A)
LKRVFLSPLLVLALCATATLPLPAPPVLAAPVAVEPDWAALVGPFPEPGSRKAEEELAVMLWLQRTRTRADVARAQAEAPLSPALFKDVLGKDFDPASRPRTFALLEQVRKDSNAAVGPLKRHFARPRPYLTAPGLTPAVHLENTFSYPSGHASMGSLYGRILAELVPAQKDAILERGELIGNDRTMAGVHWPSDVDAGHRLGQAYAAFWLAQPEHQRLVQDVRTAEWP